MQELRRCSLRWHDLKTVAWSPFTTSWTLCTSTTAEQNENHLRRVIQPLEALLTSYKPVW